MLTSGNTMLKPALISADTCTWTNQRWVLWPADQSQLTWSQYSSSGPIRDEYCCQVTNHSSPAPAARTRAAAVAAGARWRGTSAESRWMLSWPMAPSCAWPACGSWRWGHLASAHVRSGRRHGVTASYAPIVTTTLSVTRIMVNSRYWKQNIWRM